MSTGEIVFAFLVGIQGLLFLVGFGLMIEYFKNFTTKKSDKLYFTAFMLWAISPLFSTVGVCFWAFF